MIGGSSFYAQNSNARPSREEWAANANWVGRDGIWVSLPADGRATWGTTVWPSKFWTYVVDIDGAVKVSARRLGAPTPPGFDTSIGTPQQGYGPPGFIPAGLLFPADGCWEVTYAVGAASLAFVVDVQRR